MTPYTDTKVTQSTFTRIFSEDTAHSELVWHRDRKHRRVKVLESNGWKFQMDNQLPSPLREGDILKIDACTFHRVIKGQGNLVVEITEYETGNII